MVPNHATHHISHHVWENFKFIEFKLIEFRFLENALIHIPLHSKLISKFLSLRHRQKEITHSPSQYSFENRFPPTAERGAGNYDLLYQNSVRKCEDDLEH